MPPFGAQATAPLAPHISQTLSPVEEVDGNNNTPPRLLTVEVEESNAHHTLKADVLEILNQSPVLEAFVQRTAPPAAVVKEELELTTLADEICGPPPNFCILLTGFS